MAKAKKRTKKKAEKNGPGSGKRECPKCGAESLLVDGTQPDRKATKAARTHWDMLLERRSVAELEVLLEEDISGGVLGALRQRDEGVYRFFSPTAGSPDGDLRGKVLDVADQLGMFLALPWMIGKG